jgi:hypothetical protein
MSSTGITYFVVAYNSDTMRFTVDEPKRSEMFRCDTWDTVDECWCYLDTNLDMVESMKSLNHELIDILKKGQSENGNEYNIGID